MKVLYFAWLKEKTGIGEEDISLPENVTDIEGLIGFLKNRGGGFEKAFSDTSLVRVALNMEHVQVSAAIKDSDEIAFFPPVTGG
ncbi:MAG: molybdopterin converting factor subunit 1 [Rhodospirillaceae bacterium]|nr:molybdopterin converting factor subunit 1 [Rhodospirillaceae bacterium]